MISHENQAKIISRSYSGSHFPDVQWHYSEYHKPEKSCEAGNNPIASGYAMKAKPGPDFTTSVTSIQFLL